MGGSCTASRYIVNVKTTGAPLGNGHEVHVTWKTPEVFRVIAGAEKVRGLDGPTLAEFTAVT
jgi:hypothetical protein